MRDLVNGFKSYPSLGIASALVWGLVEFIALQRTGMHRGKPQD